MKDFSTLGAQPTSIRDIPDSNTSRIVISAIVGREGKPIILSHYGDERWDLSPFIEQASRSKSEMHIDWRKVPRSFRDQFKAILYKYWMVGRPGFSKPSAGLIRDAAIRLRVFANFLESLSVYRLADVLPIHIWNFTQDRKNAKLGTSAQRNVFSLIKLLYIFREEHPDSLTFEPWGETTAAQVAGHQNITPGSTRRESGTQEIPQEDLFKIFTHCERTLISANQILNERDAGLRSTSKDVELNSIRDCCFVLIGLLTGMRCDEILGIKTNASRTEVKDGFTFHWIASIEHKTKKGAVEYLVSEMGLDVLAVMERWAEPHHARVEREIDELLHRTHTLSTTDNKKLEYLLGIRRRIFMSTSDSNTLSGRIWGKKLNRIATESGTQWKLSPHQFRRTYARTFVQHRLGNLLFLKEQFKHSTLDMTQLYSANQMQDETLYDECLAELFRRKVETVDSWLSEDVSLSGGAGRRIAAMRGHVFANREALIRETASKVTIRSTGHSWCLSQDAEGCGGQGLYERPRCVPCGNSVIDRNFEPVWRELYEHQKELQKIALGLGPAAQQRVERDLQRARQVLRDLGNALL